MSTQQTKEVGTATLTMNTTRKTARGDWLSTDQIYLLTEDVKHSKSLLQQLNEVNCGLQVFTDPKALASALTSPQLCAGIIIHTLCVDSENDHVAATIKLQLEFPSLPPLVFLTADDSISSRLAAIRAGGQHFLSEPINQKALYKVVEQLLTQLNNSQRYKVLLVDDDPAQLRYYKASLKDNRLITQTLSQPLDTLHTLAHFQADVIVIRQPMSGCCGLELGQVIRQSQPSVCSPVIYLYDEADENFHKNVAKSDSESFLFESLRPDLLIEAIIAKAQRIKAERLLEQQLQDSLDRSELYHYAMDQHNIVSITDTSGRITEVNDRFCVISSYQREELIGQNHRLLKSEHHDKAFYTTLWQTISAGKVWRGEICNLRKNGEEYWVNSTIVPYLNREGKPWQYVSVRTDITALRVSQRRLDRAQNFANISTWDWDINTNKLHLSEHLGPLFGYPEGITEVSLEDFKAVIHRDDLQLVLDAIDNCIENNKDFDIEHRTFWPDRSVHWVHESGDVIRNTKGEAIRMLGVVRDISNRKKAEQQQRHNNRILESIAKDSPLPMTLSLLIEQAQAIQPDMFGAVFITDPGKGYLYCGAAPSLPNTLTSALDALKIDFNKSPQPNFYAGCITHQPPWQHFQAVGEKKGFYICDSKIIQSSAGQFIGLLLMYSNTPDAQYNDSTLLTTELARFAAVAIEQKQVLWSLIEAKEEADNANRAKSQFLSHITHDLRTPLTAIMGFGQLLSMDKSSPLSQLQQDSVDEINKASEHLLDLINDILNLAQIESGLIELKMEAVNTCELVGECESLIAPLTKERDINLVSPHVKADSPDALPFFVTADRKRLKQILLNLLSNAVKYNRHGGSIRVSYQATGNNLRIRVTDTGKGLTEKQQSRLFSAFERLEAENTNTKGSGIGLVVAKGLVENMAGTIGVESECGKGSTFWVELPKAPHNLE